MKRFAVACLGLLLLASPAWARASEEVARDWPDLQRYQADNAALPPPAADVQRVVFLGDSITDAWGRGVGTFFPGKPYVNRGISGQTTPQMLLRLRQDVIALKPAALVVLAGTNDIAGNTGPMTVAQIQDNLASITELAQAHGIAVVLATLLPVYGDEETVRRPPATITALNAWIRDYCKAGHCTLLDYHAATVDKAGLLPKALSEDGLHPNAQGYAVMGPLAEAAIAEALKRKP